MASNGTVSFPVSLKPGLYRWPAVRAFLIALPISGVAWALYAGWHFSTAPGAGLAFPLITLLAVVAPVIVLVRALARARHARRDFDFDSIVYLDSTRVVVGHSLKGSRHELMASQVHAILLVCRPAGPGHPVAAPKVCCVEIISAEGDVLRSEPHEGPVRLRKALQRANATFVEEERSEPLAW